MHPRLTPTAITLLLGVTAGLPGQQTLLVGPGHTFATIPAAITAAAPGDTVLVVGGSHQGPIDIDKRLQLVGAGGTIAGASFTTEIRVHDLAVTEAVVVRGFNIDNDVMVPIFVTNCAGPVTLHDLGNPGGIRGWSVWTTLAAQVHVARARLTTVQATQSTVAIEQCVIDPPATILPTVQGTASTFALVRCTVTGSSVGMPALRLVSGGAAAITRSSLIGTGVGVFAQPAIAAGAEDPLLIDPSTTLTSQSGTTIVGGTPLLFEFPSLRASSNGAVLTAEAHGPAGQVFAACFSGLAPAVPTPFGLTWLDLATFTPLYLGVLDPGTRLHTATIPHAPQPPGLVLAMQTVGLGAGGLVLGLPTVLSMP